MDSFLGKRPFSVTFTMWGVFLLGLWQVGRIIALLDQRELFVMLNIQPSPMVRVGLSLAWASLFFGLLIALWGRRPLARKTAPIAMIVYSLYQLAFLLFFTQSNTIQQNLLSHTLFYIGVSTLFFWALNRPTAQAYFRKGD